jgi:hypothetical protein
LVIEGSTEGLFLAAAMIASACGSEVTETNPSEPPRNTHCGETTSSCSMCCASDGREFSSQET